ncbi:DedA family protein [Actinacidiphila bryophytorum]|uniref:Membrane protein DedA, SNARE-associated domain n=1 Tax=Actinacidiphila bryophytorum TaxID=1436133 RepID=A0A9W4EDM8_9ACTN|nr:VTT domain-containing protein [Actinacidiphila bryophytorum]MBM9434417.1 VTT domain-containing protein [Actinacidiphila bryophytorum]MBN6543341.1 VTT domain-containing protein [Actinacidiphila bryophytorum]CAG7625816.1 Membrane protein DedA, SNARE-associated domain [Actinacidiphila bryophytorum]
MDVALSVSSLDFTSGLAEYLRGGHVIWAYALLAVTTAPPLVPNSVLLVTGGVMAAEGHLNLALVLLVVAGSAVFGDLVMHRTGQVISPRVLSRMHRRPRREALLRWTALRIQRHGVPFVIGVRFLPSGRIIGGLAAGIVRYPARRYAIGAGVAESVWASYSVGAGYISGRAASNSLYALSLGLGISLAVAGVGTVAQWASRARERRQGTGVTRPSAVVASSVANKGGAAALGPAGTPGAGGTPTIGPPAASRDGYGDTFSCSSAGREK